MNKAQLLLIQLAEECNEVAQRVSKALRFGLDEIQDGQNLNNAERIMGEFADLIGVYEILRDSGVLSEVDRNAVSTKKKKVIYFAAYSEILFNAEI